MNIFPSSADRSNFRRVEIDLYATNYATLPDGRRYLDVVGDGNAVVIDPTSNAMGLQVFMGTANGSPQSLVPTLLNGGQAIGFYKQVRFVFPARTHSGEGKIIAYLTYNFGYNPPFADPLPKFQKSVLIEKTLIAGDFSTSVTAPISSGAFIIDEVYFRLSNLSAASYYSNSDIDAGRVVLLPGGYYPEVAETEWSSRDVTGGNFRFACDTPHQKPNRIVYGSPLIFEIYSYSASTSADYDFQCVVKYREV